MSNPLLRNWRLIQLGSEDDFDCLGSSFLGEVTGHPRLNDGWIITSAVRWIADDKSCARTNSRLYRLENEFPRDQAMPEKPRNILATVFLQHFFSLAGLVTIDQMAELTDEAQRIANHLCGPSPPRH
jgi:hypothetical protein